MNYSDDEKPKKKRKARKKKIGRAPREFIVLKNKDKGFHESYKKRDSPIRFPHPFRLACLGGVNSGKSLTIKNVILAHARRKPKFREVIVVNPNTQTREYDDLDITCLRTTIPAMDEMDQSVKKLVVLDDYDFTNMGKEEMTRLSELVRYGSTHCNCSVIISHQSWFRVPKIAKDCCNVFIIWRPKDIDELHTIGRRVGLKKEEITQIFKDHMPNWRDSLLINHSIGAPYIYGKNLFKRLNIDEDSDFE